MVRFLHDLCVIAHMLSALAMKAFAKPREITWIAGVLLLLITFGFGFTGYLLPWNQIAVNATKVGLASIDQMGQYLPAALSHLAEDVRVTIQGAPAIGQATLSRFFALHVVIPPLLVFGVIGLHVLSVQLHGMSPGIEDKPRRKDKFFPIFILKTSRNGESRSSYYSSSPFVCPLIHYFPIHCWNPTTPWVRRLTVSNQSGTSTLSTIRWSCCRFGSSSWS
ncbi:MAG: cytochrome b N-terminal domain-containing protein [bacterium]|nr:cytochrome b N-terminal domain-containing protein [bacterium]